MANLLAQDPIIKKQLLEKNWNVHQDGSNLYQAVALDNMFTNFAEIGEKYITCDVARFGADLAVIKVWEGWRMIALRIFTKSSITDLYHCIELLRELHKIPISQVVVDQD
ncbi:MAG: hypothetical protein LBD75_07355 [Candidatus Peribacteria bacterium]|nr:hypothetical protein [Candidatus Peribacteria bacterium]